MAESKSLLPEDLLLEILYRLPVKTLIRFTCVCKQWLSLIRSPQFATKQLLTTESNLSRYNFQFFFALKRVRSGENDRVLASFYSYESFELSARFEFSPCHTITISDPCHGIFCVRVIVDYRETTFLLWNPSIREIELLPFPLPLRVPEQEDYLKIVDRVFGFGYDPEINDYKVFVIFKPLYAAGSRDVDWPVEVYNLRDGCWKFLPANSFHESMCPKAKSHGILLYGTMCSWINDYNHITAQKWLISFDLVNEIFLKTHLPECCKLETYFDPQLLQSNKMDAKPRLMCCLNTSDHPDHPKYDIEIWELVEYGSSGYWTKQIVIEFPAYYVSTSLHSHRPLGYWQDEEALILPPFDLDDDGKIIEKPLLTYNSATKELKSTAYEHTLEHLLDCAYIESLVSMKKLCRLHNQHEHRPLVDGWLASTFCMREVNAPASSINSFPSYFFEWYDD
ncbi:hypothetical protein Dimus_015167 [Dionaea muscipula]